MSSTTGEKIQNFVINVHISLLIPSDLRYVIGQDAAFNQLRIVAKAVEDDEGGNTNQNADDGGRDNDHNSLGGT